MDYLFKSTDTGITWESVQPDRGDSDSGGSADVIVCDPNDPLRLWVAFNNIFQGWGELHKSTDGGLSWLRVFSGESISSVCVDPNDSETIWFLNTDGAYRTRDGGATWERYVDGLSYTYYLLWASISIWPSDSSRVFLCSYPCLFLWLEDQSRWLLTEVEADELAICLSDPDRMYACSSDSICSSSDGGIMWRKTDAGIGGSCIDVSPHNPDEVLISDYSGIWLSENGCKGAKFSSDGLTAQDAHHLVACDEAKRVLVCSGYDLMARSLDGSESWERHEFSEDLGGCLGQDPSRPELLYVISNSTAEFFVSHNAGQDWEMRSTMPYFLAVANHIAVDPVCNRILYVATSGYVFSLTTLYRSFDSGYTWGEVDIFTGTQHDCYHVGIDPADPTHLLVCTADGLYVSINDGYTFKRCDTIPMTPTFLRFDPMGSRTVYAGCGDADEASENGLCLSHDGGDTWSWMDTPERPIFAMAINPNKPDEFYISAVDAVYYTSDAGQTWEALSRDGLQTQASSAMLVHFEETGNTIYVAGNAVYAYYHAISPHVALSSSQSEFYSGDALSLALDLSNPGDGMFADLAVAVMLPDRTLIYLPSFWTSYSPFYSGWIPGQFSLSDYTLLEAPVDAGLPLGDYTVFAVLYEQGADEQLSNLATCQFRITTSKH